MKLSKELANRVYDILVDAGANEEDRGNFMYHHSNEDGCCEWRFGGKLGLAESIILEKIKFLVILKMKQKIG